MEWTYVVVFGLAVIGIALMRPRKTSSEPTTEWVQEMESAFESFSLQMDEENEKLLQTITGMKTQEETERAKLRQQIVDLEVKLGRMEGRMEQMSAQLAQSVRAGAKLAEASARPDASAQPEASEPVGGAAHSNGNEIRARYGELFALHDQGKSMDQIARKLNMNKGEVQLIIQLAGQEERSNA